jgi:predicted metal-binding membrane protein
MADGLINETIQPIRIGMTGEHDDFRNLDPAGRATGALAQQPRMAVYLLVGMGVVLSWSVLGAMAVRGAMGRPTGSGAPGDRLIESFPQMPFPEIVERFFALCLTPAPLAQAGLAAFGALSAMWFLMAVAMMLPSAAPLVRTYCEIADTARKKGGPVVHPLVLVAGYLSVWSAAALAFAALTMWVFSGGAPLDPMVGIAGVAALAAAGLYQFSWLKEACLKKCRNPFSILFARWSAKPAAIFRLGAEQGLWCLGCCWALMLVMFAVGVMNVFWMALIALFTLVEKQGSGPLITRLAGAILLVWAMALLLISI